MPEPLGNGIIKFRTTTSPSYSTTTFQIIHSACVVITQYPKGWCNCVVLDQTIGKKELVRRFDGLRQDQKPSTDDGDRYGEHLAESEAAAKEGERA